LNQLNFAIGKGKLKVSDEAADVPSKGSE